MVLNARWLLPVVLAPVVLGCAGVTHRARFEDLPTSHGVDAARLLTYYHMGLAAWRERDEYRDTGWDLRYFGSDETNTLGIAHERGSRLFFAFRGSQIQKSAVDRRLNFQFQPVLLSFDHTPEPVRVHRGFLKKYVSVRDEMHAIVEASNKPEITVAGHSGGGALASLAYFDLKRAFPDRRVRAITFGMPRVFNRAGAEIINRSADRFLRVVHGNDFVPRIPLRIFGFRHAGTKVILSRGRWYQLFSYYDHHPGYREELERRAGEEEPWLRGLPEA